MCRGALTRIWYLGARRLLSQDGSREDSELKASRSVRTNTVYVYCISIRVCACVYIYIYNNNNK